LRTFSEKRSNRRYRSKERALITVGKGKENIYNVLDVSYGGMGFRYLGKERRHSTIDHIDILYNNGFLMRDVEVELVRDVPMTSNTIPFRQCGLQFKKLSKDQLEMLEWFIDQVAKAET